MTQGQKGRGEDETREICSDVWGKISADVYVQEILSCLPASNLQALKTVCKEWLQLITSPYFVRLHLTRANRNRIRLLLILHRAFVECNSYNEEETKQIPCQLENGIVMGSADGLICSFSHEKCLADEKQYAATFTILNPSTQEHLTTQLCPRSPISNSIDCFWFGKGVDGEHVSVIGTFSPGSTSFELGVYSSNLQRIHSVAIDMKIAYSFNFECRGRGTLVHGAVHWAVKLYANHRWRYTIMAYHLDENRYWEMSPPAQCDFRLGVGVDGCLLAILKNEELGVFEVLIMKEYWTKYGDIVGFNNSIGLSPVGFFPDGDIILNDERSQLVKYSFKDNKFKLLIQYGRSKYDAIICLDSLTSPPI